MTSIYEPDSPERDWEREQRAERRYLEAMHAPDPNLLETGCTTEEIEEPYRLEPAVQGSLFPELEPKPLKVSTRIFRKEVA
ncbi:MAG: hypothetical protein LAP40_23500 [Acidobacteriia bacterium]|nr:hypothetical protein [Terriglobia bacterium]